MASLNLLLLFLFPLSMLFTRIFASDPHVNAFKCSELGKTCNSLLYQHNRLPIENITALYSVKTSQIKSVTRAGNEDYLVTVPCSCKEINGIKGYVYDTVYKVLNNDIFFNVSAQNYSGSAWEVGDEKQTFNPGEDVVMHLLCGCLESDSKIAVTYSVQQNDTISDIANLLSARVEEIERLNPHLAPNPGFIKPGWLLYVPMEINGLPPAPEKHDEVKQHKWVITISILSAVTLMSMCTLLTILLTRKRFQKHSEEEPKALSKWISQRKSFSLQKQFLDKEKLEDIKVFESERPVLYSLEEIAEATNNFDESRIIGEGGYGSVYFGLIGKQEVAIKKMRSNKSKEFLVELKILCRIHHINVVELLGYASGEDHLFLVYEYIPNGSLGDHLHDPAVKGHQPLSWTARTQIAVDAARGIEYIHDHTKARCVHRDIKTSNILLGEGLQAKVADFGLAKLVGRTNEDDLLATRLVGTPGYLPPESVKDLQVTTKTDIFAFGVVLAELITGQPALIRGKEPNKIKSLITIVYQIFEDKDPESAMGSIVDSNLNGNYPMEDVYKMGEIAYWCLSEEPVERPEMREVVLAMSQIRKSSFEWEASLGGNSQVFSGLLFNGR